MAWIAAGSSQNSARTLGRLFHTRPTSPVPGFKKTPLVASKIPMVQTSSKLRTAPAGRCSTLDHPGNSSNISNSSSSPVMTTPWWPLEAHPHGAPVAIRRGRPARVFRGITKISWEYTREPILRQVFIFSANVRLWHHENVWKCHIMQEKTPFAKFFGENIQHWTVFRQKHDIRNEDNGWQTWMCFVTVTSAQFEWFSYGVL